MLFVQDKMKMQRGFTLFELLISISIIGILTALAVVSYSGAQQKARNARRSEDMSLIQKAAEQYYANYGFYPIDTASFVNDSDKVLEAWPIDPKNVAPYIYNYYPPAPLASPAVTTYCACAFMEGTNQGNSTAACANMNWPNPRNYYCVRGRQE